MPQWVAVMPPVVMTQRPVPGPANVQTGSVVQAREQKPVASAGTARRHSQPVAHGLAVVQVWPRPQPPSGAPEQSPAVQTSVCVQPSPSLHTVPFGAVGFEQPLPGLHVPATWHWSLAVQTTAEPPPQAPLVQRSADVHTLPSSQGVPLARFGFVQFPVVVLQTPAVWH
jgi:hypothetical protein